MTTPSPHPAERQIADRIDQAHRDWEEGRLPSPDSHDFVLFADEILTANDPNYGGSVDEGRRFVADVIYEKQSDGQLQTSTELAAFLVKELTAE